MLLSLPAMAKAANPMPFNNTGSAEAFIRDLYAHYGHGEKSSPQLLDRDAGTLAGPELLALTKRDHELVPNEIGAYDSDPICSCQDTDGMVLKDVRVTQETRTNAKAEVTLNFTSDKSSKVLDFALTRIDGQWRIENILDKTDNANLLEIFQKGVAFEETHPE